MEHRFQRGRGAPPPDISQRTPRQKRLVEEMRQWRSQRISEVRDALRRYCPSGEPPCSPDPPRYLLDQATALGLIEFVQQPARPTTESHGIVDEGGAVSIQCY